VRLRFNPADNHTPQPAFPKAAEIRRTDSHMMVRQSAIGALNNERSSRRAWRPLQEADRPRPRHETTQAEASPGGEMDGVERFFAALTVAGCVSLFAALAWMIFSGI
jgi:hypothetical protein